MIFSLNDPRDVTFCCQRSRGDAASLLGDETRRQLCRIGCGRFHAGCDHCDGQDALGSTIGPSLVERLPDLEAFRRIVGDGTGGGKMKEFANDPNVAPYIDNIFAHLRPATAEAGCSPRSSSAGFRSVGPRLATRTTGAGEFGSRAPQVITLLPGCAIAGPARPAHNADDPITAALASMTVESAGSGALRPAVRPPERGAKTAVLQTSYRCSELAPRNPPRA
jgi:hypothetical protein